MISRRDREVFFAGAKFAAFAVVALVVVITVAATIRPFGGGGSASYRAIFSNASRLKAGDDVRASGVVVGRINDVHLLPDYTVEVDFSLSSPVPLTTGTHAAIHYLDLIGDRDLALTQGTGSPLANGGEIPLARTQPALDLNQLFNGFKPLFAALSPNDINAVSLDIIKTLQGEGPQLDALMQHTASLTGDLATRDRVIGDVITNLNTVLGTVSDRQDQVNLLVAELTRFVRGTADDRATIGTAIDQISQLTNLTAGLVSQSRPGLRADISQLGQLASRLNRPGNQAAIEDLLTGLGPKFAAIARTASNGSWFNYYACELGVHVSGKPDSTSVLSSAVNLLLAVLGGVGHVNLSDTASRCHQ